MVVEKAEEIIAESASVDQDIGGGQALQPPSAKDAVYAMLGCQLRTTLSDGRVVEGKLQCMDRLTNFILADAVETGTAAVPARGMENGDSEEGGSASEVGVKPAGQQRHLGLVMIPGKHLVSVQRLADSRRTT